VSRRFEEATSKNAINSAAPVRAGVFATEAICDFAGVDQGAMCAVLCNKVFRMQSDPMSQVSVDLAIVGQVFRVSGEEPYGSARPWNSLAAVSTKVEGEHAAAPLRSLQYLGVTQSAHGVVITGTPVILHAQSGEIVVFRGTFIAL
jgi:hypothetical protein